MTRSSGDDVDVEIGTLIEKIESCEHLGGGPAWIYWTAQAEAKVKGSGGVIAERLKMVVDVWCNLFAPDVSADAAARLLARILQVLEGGSAYERDTPSGPASVSEDDVPF